MKLKNLTVALASTVLYSGIATSEDLKAEKVAAPTASSIVGKSQKPVSLDLANARDYQFLIDRVRLTGNTPENSPQLFRMIKESRARHLKMPAEARAARSTLSDDIHHSILSSQVGKNRITQNQEMLGRASSTITGKINYTYTDVVIRDAQGIQIGIPGSVEGFADGANQALAISPSDAEYIRDNYEDEDVFTAESLVVVEDANGEQDYKLSTSTFLAGQVKSKVGANAAAGILEVIEPTDKNEDNKIQVCLNRDHGDCDYDQMYPPGTPNDQLVIKIPFNGSITTPHKIDKIFAPDENHGALITSRTGVWIKSNTGEHAYLKDPVTQNSFFDYLSWREIEIDGKMHSVIAWDIPKEEAIFGKATMYDRFANVEWELHVVASIWPKFFTIRPPIVVDFTADNSQTPQHQYVIEDRLPFMYFEYSCIAKGTMITMADGSQKLIEEIKAGDRVLSNGTPMKVADTSIGYETLPMIKITSTSGESVMVTETHPVITKRGAVWAKEVVRGDELVSNQGRNRVVRVEEIQFDDTVHNLKLEPVLPTGKQVKNATMLANGIPLGDLTFQAELSFKDQAKSEVEATLEKLPKRWHQDYLNSLKK